MRIRLSLACLLALCGAKMPLAMPDPVCASVQEVSAEPPMVLPKVSLGGEVRDPPEKMAVAEVFGCCLEGEAQASRELRNRFSGLLVPKVIGYIPQMTANDALAVLAEAKAGWKGGAGEWPQLSLADRIDHIERFVAELQTKREEIVATLMWEIGKNRNDAAAEFDRTVAFVEKLVETIRTDPEFSSSWQTVGSTRAFVRRAAIGIIMCMGPYNYPLNETYATLIPALLMGNVCVMKIPTVGGLSHLLTMEAFAKTLPRGTMNFISGAGRSTMPPLMETGDIDGLAFIGGSNAADKLIKQHPHPHRLKVFLQLEAKNMAVFLPDMFKTATPAEFKLSLDQSMIGSLSYNGQRCTALKLFFIPKGHGEQFAERLAQRVDEVSVGLPWQRWPESNSFSSVTPLPNQKRVEYMKTLIDDAVSKGARIMNADGGQILGGSDSTLMVPAVLYPVKPDMKLFYEEQFGPVIPVAEYDDINEVLEYGLDGLYGQQVSIFTSQGESSTAAKLIDMFSSVYGKININSQCGRSPDSLPFSGRRSSAMGVMSVKDALKEFSIPTVVAYKESTENEAILGNIEGKSRFLTPVD